MIYPTLYICHPISSSADDCVIYGATGGSSSANALQSSLHNWCSSWSMQLNINKCKLITSMGKCLAVVSPLKHLGVHISSNSYMTRVCNAANSPLDFMRRTFLNVTPHLYKSLVRPKLEHAVSVSVMRSSDLLGGNCSFACVAYTFWCTSPPVFNASRLSGIIYIYTL